MINESTVDRILEASEIQDVISDFINIKKRGANYITNCPFHNEKTPSFSISPSKGIFKCFGCGIAGNSAKFVMEHEKVSYPDALKYLAKKYNIEVEETKEVWNQNESYLISQSLYMVNEFVNQHFIDNFHAPINAKAKGYMLGRGFTEETLKKFGIGYDDGNVAKLELALKNKGYEVSKLHQLGIVIKGNYGTYSQFRNRVTFPIHSISGQVIGFGGRIIDKNIKAPKYVNTPENELYHKEQVVYGLYQAKNSIRKLDSVILTEGYTDVDAAHQEGVENTVSSSGTSLTAGQLKKIKRFSRNIIFLYDGDSAGLKAIVRGVNLAFKQGFNVKICLLPHGTDPDSYIKQKNKIGLKEYIETKQINVISFFYQIKDFKTSSADVKANIIQKLVATLAKVEDDIERTMYLQEMSSIFNIDMHLLTKQMSNEKFTKKYISKEEKELVISKEPIVEKDRLFYIERDLVDLLLFIGDFLTEEDVSFNINDTLEILFQLTDWGARDNINGKILSIIFHWLVEQGDIHTSDYYLNYDEKDIREYCLELLISPYSISNNWHDMHDINIKKRQSTIVKELKDLVARYILCNVEKMIIDNTEAIKNVKTEIELKEHLEIHKALHKKKRNVIAGDFAFYEQKDFAA